MTRASATPTMGTRRRRRSGLRCCSAVVAAAAAGLVARTPSKLMTHAFLTKPHHLRVTGAQTFPASAYRSSINSSGARCASKMQAAPSVFRASSGRSDDRGRRGVGDVQQQQQQQYGFGVRTPATRSWTALAAASRDTEGGGNGGEEAEEGGGVSGVWAVQDEEDWEFEEEVQRLEERLERAVKNEDYKGAAKCRDELYRWVYVSCVLL